MSVTLRQYQHEAISAVGEAYRRGLRRVVISLPTGTGKTVVMARMIRGAYEKGNPVLLLAHRDELLEQARDKLCNVAPDLCDQIGFVRADQDEWDRPIVIASVQTLSRPARVARLVDAGVRFSVIFTDETHHAAADSYQRIYEALGALEPDTPILMVGVSATPQRADDKDLSQTFQEIVYHKDLLWAMREGFLVDLKAYRVQLRFDPRELKVRGGEFAAEQAAQVLENAEAPYHTVQAWKRQAADRRTIVFTPTIRLAQLMAQEYRDQGVAARCISGIDMDERRSVLAAFHTGEVQVVTNAMILTEGFDEPAVDCIVIARPTKSHILYKQMVGRGTRPYLDPVTGVEKQNCLILDMSGATDRLDLLSAASLLPLGDVTADAPEEEVRQKVQQLGLLGAYDYYEEQRRQEGRIVTRQVNLFSRKNLNWIMSRPGFWSIGIGKQGTLVCQVGADNRWAVHRVWVPEEVDALGRTPSRLETLGADLDLGYAMGMAEDYARQAGAKNLLDKNAKWRTYPASPGQLEELTRLGIEAPEGATKGWASDQIGAAKAVTRTRKLLR